MDSIDPAFDQKFTFIKHHVNVQLRKWKVLKPHFATILTKNISPAVQSVMVQCLTRFRNQIAAAMKSLLRATDYIDIICTVNQLQLEKKELQFIGFSLYNLANNVRTKADILLEKFKNNEPIPFKTLPYEFQSRLVELLPRGVLIRFTLAGKSAAKSVKRRGETFSNSLIVTEKVDFLTQFTLKYKSNKQYNVLDTSDFLKLSDYYSSYGVCLISRAVETFDHAVKILSGTYSYVDLRHSYTWRHAIHLMNVSKVIKFTYLWHYIQLEVQDFDEFFEAVVHWLLNKKAALMFHMVYNHLDDTFLPRFEAIIKTRTKLNFHSIDAQVVVYKTIKL